MSFRAICLSLPLVLSATASLAQDRPGDFDHYVLSLSWVPAYCAADGDDRNDPRCRDDARVGWAVHGLWPQNDDGTWPEYCHGLERDPSRQQTAAQADVFGTSGSAWHQWNKHGRCTGLSASAFYDLTRQALAGVTLPEIFDGVTRELSIDPDVIEAAFIEANPELTPDMMVTSCQRRNLAELRICLTRELQPRDCAPQAIRRECDISGARLLPLR